MLLIARLIVIGMLIWALDRHPYDYYTLLRFAVFCLFSFEAWLSRTTSKGGKLYVCTAAALLYNPFLPVHLSKAVWQSLNVSAALYLAILIDFDRKEK